MIKKILIILLCFSMVFQLSSCNNKNSDKTQGYVFTDALNREVYIKSNPQRVACLIGSFADVWVLSGGTVCAAADDAWDDFDLELPEAANIGGAHSPSLEHLISSEPDLVIASASTSSNIELCDTLESMGITVIYFDVDDFNDYLYMLGVCTDITGRKDLYQKNGLDIKKEIDDIKNKYLQSDIPDKERRILLLRTSSSSVKAKGSDGTILGEMLSDLGCINIADSDTSLLENLSIESIIQNEPHHIFAVTMGSDTQKAVESLYGMIDENPAWNTLDAVKNNRLHVMDKTLFNLKPNDRWADAYEILYEKLTNK